MTAVVRVSMAPLEQVQLGRLVGQLLDMLGADRDLADPAFDRLAPNPYPEDDGAAAEYRAATLTDILDRRAADAVVVSDAVAIDSIDELSDEDAMTEQDFAIPAHAVDAWLRTLTALRLVIATRLGIDSEEDHDPEDPRFGVFDWLGYRLEVLIESAEAQGV